MELSQTLLECYSISKPLVNQTRMLSELLQFAEELNCSEPDTFQLSPLPVDQEGCFNWSLYSE